MTRTESIIAEQRREYQALVDQSRDNRNALAVEVSRSQTLQAQLTAATEALELAQQRVHDHEETLGELQTQLQHEVGEARRWSTAYKEVRTQMDKDREQRQAGDASLRNRVADSELRIAELKVCIIVHVC